MRPGRISSSRLHFNILFVASPWGARSLLPTGIFISWAIVWYNNFRYENTEEYDLRRECEHG